MLFTKEYYLCHITINLKVAVVQEQLAVLLILSRGKTTYAGN